MHSVYRLENQVQEYAWGSPTWIPEMLGQVSPAPRPQAELWMGAHPKAPSLVLVGEERVPLDRLIERHPEDFLGPGLVSRFGRQLPFLFKLLAAHEPLSIQAHPSLAQARVGFAAEEEAGIPRDAPTRNYRDANHKPECLCALTEFWALCGFRPLDELRELLQILLPSAELDLLIPLQNRDLRGFFRGMMSLAEQRRTKLLGEVLGIAVHEAKGSGARAEICHWIVALHGRYPGDIGVLAPAFLNLVRLLPGQAIALPAQELHAYLRGLGVELMANSDNVLRGGLTSKHVDPPELLRVLRFESRRPRILEPVARGAGEEVYPSDAQEFELARIRTTAARGYRASAKHGVEILFCTSGRGTLRDGREELAFGRGASFLVPAAAGAYEIEGEATLFRAGVPLPDAS